jgi:hypothetical protein
MELTLVPSRRQANGAARLETLRPTVIGAVAGEERRRLYGERIGRHYTWLPYDSLEILPHVLEGVTASGVVVDLVHWTPVEVAPVLRALRHRWPALRIIGLYGPSAEALPEIARLARSDRHLAFTSNPDERLELLLRPVPEALAAITPTAGQSMLDHFLPLAADAGVRHTLIHLALSPSRRQGVPVLAAMQGWSEDALERRFAAHGLSSPAMMRRLAVAAEGLWHVAALKRPGQDVALALGLGTGDSLGRVIKGIFGFGLKAARLMGAEGAQDALLWVGLLGLRDLAKFGGLPVAARVRLKIVGDRPATLPLEDTRGPLWSLLAEGFPLGVVVDRLSTEPDAGRQSVAELVPFIRWLLHHSLVVPVPPARNIL